MKLFLQYIFPTLLVFCSSLDVNSQMINTFPYNQDFDLFTTCGTGCGATCALSNGWVNSTTDEIDWITNLGSTSSSSTGPSADHTTGFGNYLYVETSCSGTGYPNKTANLLSPQINLVGTNNLQFEFWYHMFGATMGDLHVDISSDSGNTWTNDVVPSWTDNVDLWQKKTISLGAWVGDTVIVRLRYISGIDFYGDIAVDDFHMYDLLQNDAGISAFVNPSFPTCIYNDSVEVVLTNYGTDTLTSVNIDWEWNGVAQAQVPWTGVLAPGSSQNVYLASIPYNSGDTLSAYTGLPNGFIEISSGNGNDTTTLVMQTGLSGVYTIGSTGNYPSFTSAITALNTYGVCGPVVFEVQDSTYSEQIVLKEVIGMSQINTVTFQSENNDPSLVILDFPPFNSSQNYVVLLDGADYFRFKNITFQSSGASFGRVIEIENGASFNEWTGNIIKTSNAVATTSTNMALVYSSTGNSIDTMNVFDGNTFENGSYSMYWHGDAETSLEKGTVVKNNNFVNFYYIAIHLYYQENIQVLNNTFIPGSSYTGSIYRVYMVNCDGPSTVANNQINGMSYGYGIYISNSDATILNPAKFYNNFIHIGDTNSASTSYGIYVTNSANQSIINNSVNIESAGASSRAFFNTGGYNTTVCNNIFSNNGPGYGVYYNVIPKESDNNIIYTPNGILFNFFGGDINDLNSWKAITGFDLNSDTINPLFVSGEDLHTCASKLDGKAKVFSWLTTDIDGQMRDTKSPDIGADEFLGISNLSFSSDTLWKCPMDTLLLGGWQPTNDNIMYYWNTTDTTPSISVTNQGTYSVFITKPGCGNSNPTAYVANYSSPVAAFSSPISFLAIQCANTSTNANSYLWDFGDGNTSTQVNPTHVYNSTGTYVVKLIAYGECSNDTTTDTIQLAIASTPELSSIDAINIYPNPNNGDFEVIISTKDYNSEINLSVLNSIGQLLHSEKAVLSNGLYRNKIVLNDKSKGIYFIKIEANNESTTRKVVIK